MAQEITAKNSVGSKLDKDKVRPKDTVTVYSLSKDKFHPDGEPMEVHPSLAEKLVASGKATMEAPKSSSEKETKK